MFKRTCLAVTIAHLAACGGIGGSTDIEPTLRFADLDDGEIGRLVSAASGSEGFQAQGQLGAFEDPIDPDPCPAIAIDGNTVTITGGCTTIDEVGIEGSAKLTNPTNWGDLEYDFGDDSIYELSQFAYVQQGTRRSYDGVFRIGSGYGELDMDVTVDSFGGVVRSDIYMECGGSSCTVGNSGVELVGFGGARVSGKIVASNGGASGSYTLDGVDTVKVTITESCVTWKLEGTDRGSPPCR